MAIKKLQNNFTTTEQSKRLLELGLPADSADCCFYLNTNYSDKPHILYKKLSEKQADYDSPFSSIKAVLHPCWSVGRLMEIFDICNLYELHKFSTRDWSVNIKSIMEDYEVAAEEKMLDFSKLED